jgi:hypothetical protein
MNKPSLRGLDARTIAAVALLLIVLLACWQVAWQRETVHEKDRQINALIRISQGKDADAERAATAADQDRATAAANQAALLDYTRALADRQHALLEWLRANGIEIPTRYVVEIRPPKVVKQSRPHSKRAPADRSQKRDLPGKSERGHYKGRGRR